MVAELKRISTLTIEAREPFDFARTAAAYNFGWYFDGTSLFLPLGAGLLAFALVRPRRGGVDVELFAQERLDEDWAAKRVETALGLQEDLSAFWRLAERDTLLKQAAWKLRGMRLRSLDLWTAFIVAACQQNASFRQGWTIVANILSSVGERVIVAGRKTVVPPSPRDVLRAGAHALKKARAGFRASAILASAELFAERGQELERMSLDELEAVLSPLRGVGPYTTRVAALFGLRRYDTNPVDRWLARVMSTAYGTEVTSLREAEKLWMSRWDRWTGLAAFFTTIVTDALPAPRALDRVRKGELLPRELPYLTPMTLWRWTAL